MNSIRDCYTIFNLLPVPLAIHDDLGNMTFFNKAFEKTLGYTTTDIPTLDAWWLAAYPDPAYRQGLATLWQQFMEEAKRSGKPFGPMEADVCCKDGSVRTVFCSAAPVEGKKGYHLAILQDITEGKLVEENLRYSEERFSVAFQNGPSLMTISDFTTGRFIDVNDAFIRISGYSREEAIGRTPDELGWARREDLQHVYRQLKEKDRIAGWEVKVTSKTGENIWCEYFGKVISTSSGDILMSIAQDITERKQVQEALLLKNLVFDQSIAANSISDREGLLTEVNKAFVKVWGYESQNEVIGKPIPHFLADRAKAQEIVAHLVTSSQWEGDYSAKRKDGSNFTAHGLATVVRDATGEIIGFQSSVIDVSERTQAEKLLAEARDAAEAANRAKSQFLANMSHETRTPITGIIGFVELLEDTKLSKLQKKYLKMISISSENLMSIVNEILDLSKIEAGKVNLENNPFDIRVIIEEIFASQVPIAKAKRLSFEKTIDMDVPEILIGDPVRVKQILLNIVNNAIKFTEEGLVSLSVSVEELQPSATILRFDISDSGIGIRREDLLRIYEPFRQVDSSNSRKYGGTGLGLSICKMLTTLMEGELWADSRFGTGSTFHVRLPFVVSDMAKASTDTQETSGRFKWEGRPLQVLLVEDCDTSRMLFTEMLKAHGHVFEIARDGAEALGKWSVGRYDIVLMDVQMPVMDGFETVERIRAIEGQKGGYVPIIALTAHAMENYRIDILKKGFDGYVTKPTTTKVLFNEMKQCLDKSKLIHS